LASGQVALREELDGLGGAVLYARVVQEAALLNTPVVVARVNADPRFRQEQNSKAPRKIGSMLWLFDCINCDKCVPVCPNDSNFVYETGVHRAEYRNYEVKQGAVVEVPGGLFEVKKEHQIANFQDFCNECGNCDVFCPEDGGPFIEKPRFFGSLEAWRRLPRDGFYCLRQDDVDAAWARIRGVEYHLEVDRARDRALFTDGAVRLELRHSERRPLQASARAGTAEGHTLDFAAYLNMALAVGRGRRARSPPRQPGERAVPAPVRPRGTVSPGSPKTLEGRMSARFQRSVRVAALVAGAVVTAGAAAAQVPEEEPIPITDPSVLASMGFAPDATWGRWGSTARRSPRSTRRTDRCCRR
jgi:ferredoxin